MGAWNYRIEYLDIKIYIYIVFRGAWRYSHCALPSCIEADVEEEEVDKYIYTLYKPSGRLGLCQTPSVSIRS
jgi:hypothetical protein